jgi:hypothetical protein
MPLRSVSVARSLPVFVGTVRTGSVVRSWATSLTVHVLSDEGGAASGLEARPLDAGELGDASGTAGIGTVRIFLVLKGSFIDPTQP